MATLKDLLTTIISKLNGKVTTVNGVSPDDSGNVEVQLGAQSDWNQNDETSPAFVKNRPFYTGEPVFTEIIPEQTYTLSSTGRFTVYTDESGTYQYSLEVDKEYTVVYNGTTYKLTSGDVEGLGVVGDINPLFTGSEPTMPFAIAAGNGILQIIDYTGNTEVTFKISGPKIDIKQIDTKYIPELPKYMSKTNPVGYGSFSLNRKADTTVGANSHAEGEDTTASGIASHAEGSMTIASELTSHAEGFGTTANARFSHAEGAHTIVSTTDIGVPSYAIENGMGRYGHAEGFCTVVTGGYGAHAEGYNTKASGDSSHAEGRNTKASSDSSHAEGRNTKASSNVSHAEGYNTKASGDSSHAEGYNTEASSNASHAEGFNTVASGAYSHAEGYDTTASGYYSHAEGSVSVASGVYSHAEGYDTTASGKSAHSEGFYTVASSDHQHVQGKYNIEDSNGVYAHIVGNGTDSKRSNCHTIDWNGNAWFSGAIESKSIIISSSTADSTKRFRITVDDSGAISATEVT